MKLLIAICVAIFLPGCGKPEPAEARRPEQAGQAMDPLKTAARIALIRSSAVLGDQEAVRANMEGMQEDFRKSIKLADPARRIDRESARAIAGRVEGVRSVAWIDHENLLAIVSTNEARSYDTIDSICMGLEPLGDTLGVVVNLQSGAARSGDELEILSRNCQLRPGDRAMLQRNRQIDVISPQIRAQHRANQVRSQEGEDRSAEQAESMRVLEATTPEM